MYQTVWDVTETVYDNEGNIVVKNTVYDNEGNIVVKNVNSYGFGSMSL